MWSLTQPGNENPCFPSYTLRLLVSGPTLSILCFLHPFISVLWLLRGRSSLQGHGGPASLSNRATFAYLDCTPHVSRITAHTVSYPQCLSLELKFIHLYWTHLSPRGEKIQFWLEDLTTQTFCSAVTSTQANDSNFLFVNPSDSVYSHIIAY